MEKLILVYEPVWAIGRKDAASQDVIQKSHIMVRDAVSQLYDNDTALKTRIIYGGSVNYKNSGDIIQIPEVDGLAITRGALDPEEFCKIIRLVDKESRKRAGSKNKA
ncbi:MAG: triose-phosphate isomerase [Actinomycetota bacterium]|nr:triose-phosphate isomerase [Actinomycetota bacterium]